MSNVPNTRQIRFVRRTSCYWRVTFDNPPLNIFGPETIPELNEVVTALETDQNVKVVVFDSAVEGLPPDAEIAPEWDACLASIQRPAAQTRINKLIERGFHKPGDVESRLGYHVGQLGD